MPTVRPYVMRSYARLSIVPWPATATELSRALVAKQLSAQEVVTDTFARIAGRDGELGAFLSIADVELALETARRIDKARMSGASLPQFAGLPIAIKDNLAVEDHTLTCGSRILSGYSPPYTATSVARLQAAGMIVVGKTNLDEFGFGSSTENSAFLQTKNPRRLDRVPGGSSGGSAAAVASEMVPWALGTDTGGSVRQPASLCGIVGVRPSYGRVSRYGIVAFGSSMDQVGPLARTVDDAASLLSLIMGPDSNDSTTLRDAPPDLSAGAGPLRVGIPVEYISGDCDAAVRNTVENAAALADDLGWTVSEVSLPLTRHALSAYYVISSVEAASNLQRYHGVVYGYRAVAGTSDYADMATKTRTEGFGDEAKRRIMLGTFAASTGYYDEYYGKALKVRQLVRDEFAAVFRDVDVLLSPVSPTTAWSFGERVGDPWRMYLSDVYSVPVALAGLPAVVIPLGGDDEGLPIGIQLAGPYGRDAVCMRVARAMESARGPYATP
jgi:aspartyl-tRNA(Asn)/glutamyl-tRNA(Gln) amidotransferase subunit A